MRLYTLCTVAFALSLIALSPLRVGIVLGESMTPSLKPNHPFLIDKSYYNTHMPAKGDIVVFRAEGQVLVKRIAAGPGDGLWLLVRPPTDGCPDSDVVHPQDLAKVNKLAMWHPQVGSLEWFHVPPGQVFVLGDAENLSMDSRHFGTVPIERIIGRCIAPQAKTSVTLQDSGTSVQTRS